MNSKIVSVALLLTIAYLQGLLCEPAINAQIENEKSISKRSDIRSLKKGKPAKPLNMKQTPGSGVVSGKNNFKPSRTSNRKQAGKPQQQGQLHKKQKCVPNQPGAIKIECTPNGSGGIATLYGSPGQPGQGQTPQGGSPCQGEILPPCPPPPAPKPHPPPTPEKPTLHPYPPPPQQHNPSMEVPTQLPYPPPPQHHNPSMEVPTQLPSPPPAVPAPPAPPAQPHPQPPPPVKPAPAPVPCQPAPIAPGGSGGMPPPPNPGMPATLLPAPPAPCVKPVPTLLPAPPEIPFGSKGYEYGFGMDVGQGGAQCQLPAFAGCRKKCTMACPKRCCSPHRKIGN